MDVAAWLRRLGLEQYAPAFRDNEIDEKVLPSLTAEDLKDLGVTLVGHRRRLLDAVAALSATAPAAATPAAAPTDTPVRVDAERRQLTVMFCDLVGSTSLSTRLDPEDLREVIGAYHRAVAEIVAGFDGFVAKYMGDGVLVYFGYPRAHEDDAERAVRTGLSTIDAVGRLDIQSTKLQGRVGIATGLVVVGDLIGEGSAQEQAVVGETPNLAARLQALAAPASLVIAASTREQIGELFALDDLGPQQLAGFAEPQRAWRVLGESGEVSRFEALRSGETPLVGRDEELELLVRRWQQANSGDGRVVLISGEPGIGKSRLTAALSEHIESKAHTRLRYFCSPHHQDSALYPFIAQLERAAGFARDDTTERKLEKLEALIAPGARTREEIALVAELLSLPNSAAELNLTAQRKREMLFEALIHQLEAVARNRPVLMVFEDAHWIDPTSRALMDLTIERVRHMTVLLVVTFRPEFQQGWGSKPHVRVMTLNRLSGREGAMLVQNLAGNMALDAEIVAKIVERTDGVPLFVEELTKVVLESAEREDRVGAGSASTPLPNLSIPATLHASLIARLDRLGTVAREVAQIGAVLGREFTYELMDYVAMRRDLDAALGQLSAAGLLFCSGSPPHSSYLFKHALVQDAAYETLLRARRLELHARVAAVLEQQFGDLIARQPELLGYHLTAAGEIERAIDQWLKAGQLAASRSANLEAIAHLQRGIESLRTFVDGTKDRTELDLLYALGPCVIATQGPISNAARSTFARARELCERLEGAPEHLNVLYWLAVAHGVRGELSEAVEATEAGIVLADARGDRPALINSLRGAGLGHLLTGHLAEAQDRSQRAVAIFDTSDEVDQRATGAAGQDAGVAGLALMSWALWALGYPDTAVARINLSLNRADTVGHPHTEAYACYYASILYALCREPAVAHQYAERCLGLSEAHGFGHWQSLSRIVQGICTSLLDSTSDALDTVQAALEAQRRRGYQMGITALYVLQCDALLHRHQFECAIVTIKDALEVVSRTGERLFEGELYRLQAEAHLGEIGAGNRAQTHSILAEAVTTARRQGAKLLELRAATSYARLWGVHGGRAEARELLAPVYGWFTEGFDTADLKEARALLDELA